MSVLERVARLQEEEQRQEEATRISREVSAQESERIKGQHDIDYETLKYEHRYIQSKLLEDLRRKGVVAMIEEVIETDINPIPFLSPEEIQNLKLHERSYFVISTPKATPTEVQAHSEKNRKKPGHLFGWRLEEIPFPTLAQDNTWDDSIMLTLFKRVPVKEYPQAREEVKIIYGTNQRLSIMGDAKTGERFDMTAYNQGDIEEALANAIHKPNRIPGTRTFAVRSGPDFRPPIYKNLRTS